MKQIDGDDQHQQNNGYHHQYMHSTTKKTNINDQNQFDDKELLAVRSEEEGHIRYDEERVDDMDSEESDGEPFNVKA